MVLGKFEASVVIPVGQVDNLLAEQLDSLVQQKGTPNWELICSLNTNDPVEWGRLEQMLTDRPALNGRVVDSTSMRSASHARNVGAAAADSEHVVFCDGDDIADPNWLVSMLSALKDYDAVGGHLDEELLAVTGQEHWRPPATPGQLPEFLNYPFIVSANMGVRRELFTEVGGFDTSLIRGEDIAFSWALLERDVELGYAQDAVIHYRHRKGLLPMMRQHYMYGLGFSQILSRQGLPNGQSQTGVSALRPNGQKVANRSFAYFARRGSIAAGRVSGLVQQRRLQMTRAER